MATDSRRDVTAADGIPAEVDAAHTARPGSPDREDLGAHEDFRESGFSGTLCGGEHFPTRHEDGMTRPRLPPRSLALTILRVIRRFSQEELAEAAGLRPGTISDYERGKREPSAATVRRLAAVMGHPAALTERTLAFAAGVEEALDEAAASPEGDGDLPRRLAAEAGRTMETFVCAALSRLAAEEARRHARQVLDALRGLAPGDRRRFVGSFPELCTPAVVEAVCAESERLAADHAGRARELAELALFIAGRVPSRVRAQAQGYAWAFIGNARRVAGDLPGADEAFARSAELWGSGETDFFDGSRLLDLEASLRKDQRRLPEALELLARASRMPGLNAVTRARILIKRANVLKWQEDFEGALAVLREAAPAIEGSRDLRLIWILRCSLATNLCHLDRAAEALELLPGARALAVQIDNSLDQLRLRWLEGKVAAGLGRNKEAIEALSRVREEFGERKLRYDEALATMELAALYLAQGRTAEVKTLARQMEPIFRDQGVHEEARKALAIFRHVVEVETVTLALVRRLTSFLYRAQGDPGLRFEP
jgi:transcriptional regulator with XRE-family HTH domain